MVDSRACWQQNLERQRKKEAEGEKDKRKLPASWWEHERRHTFLLALSTASWGSSEKPSSGRVTARLEGGRWAWPWMRVWASDPPLGLRSGACSLLFPQNNRPRGAALSHRAHRAHNGGDVEGLCFSGLNIPVNSLPSGKKHCLVQSTEFPGLGLPGSILNTPVGIFSAARRRDAVCFVLFSTPSWLFPLCWFPWQNLTQTGFGLGLHAAWEGAKHMHTNIQQTLQQHGFEPCRVP